MKKIPLYQRDGSVVAHTMVDDIYFPTLMLSRWYRTAQGYAARSDNPGILMHRWLTDAPRGLEVDHWNGDKLDNRAANLRVVPQHHNKQNVAAHRDNPSGHRGVSWAPHVKLWRGRVHHAGRTYCCGYHNTPRKAAIAVAAKRAELMRHSNEERHGPATVR